MQRVFPWAALAAAILIAGPAQAQKKQSDAKGTEASQQDYQALAQMTDITGKLVNVDPTGKTVTLELEYQVLAPNGKNGTNHNLMREQQQLMRARSPVEYMRDLERLVLQAQREQANAFRVVTERKDYELAATDNVKVRQEELPPRFDDKGNLKPYTAQELKELKGPNPNLPGYVADFGSLKNGQTVKITLSHHQAARDKDKDKDPKPQAAMIVIQKDAPEPADKNKK
jgi:hypothetical protein